MKQYIDTYIRIYIPAATMLGDPQHVISACRIVYVYEERIGSMCYFSSGGLNSHVRAAICSRSRKPLPEI